MADDSPLEEMIGRSYQEFLAISQDLHLLCPKVDDDDEEDYDDLEEPGEIGIDVKKRRVEEGNTRLDLVYRCSLIMGFPEDEVQDWLRQFEERTLVFLSTCAGCVRHWHQRRKRFLKQLSEQYPDSVVSQMEERLNVFDAKRIATGLQGASQFIHQQNGVVEQRTFIDADRAELLIALYEALCCITYLSQPENRVDFNFVFQKVQEKKTLRLGEVLPTMTFFLFDEDKIRYTFAKTAWSKMRRITADEFEWAVKPSLEVAIGKIAMTQDPMQAQRFWEGFVLILRALSPSLVGPALGGLDIYPSIYQIMLNHMSLNSESALAIVLKVFCTTLHKSPKGFWLNFESYSPTAVAEVVFTSPALRRLLTQTREFSISIPEDDYVKGPVAIAWVRPFISSVVGSAKDTACDAIMHHFLENFGKDSSMSAEGRAACYRGAVEALLTTLAAFNLESFKIHAGTTTIHTNRALNLTLKHKETLIALARDRQHASMSQTAFSVIGNALLLDSRVTAEEFTTFTSTRGDKGVQHEVTKNSPGLWEAFMELLSPGATQLAKAMLLATEPLVPVEVIRARKKEVLTKPKEDFNMQFLKTISVIGSMMERLAEFSAADLKQLCEDPQTIRPIVAALINGESDINGSAIALIKTITEEDGRSDAITRFLERYFSPVLMSFTQAIMEVTQDAKLWSSQLQIILCSNNIITGLCDPGSGILRSRTLDDGECSVLVAWWASQWSYVEAAFNGLDGWSKSIGTEIMKDFCRDTMELVDSLLAQDGLISSALETSRSSGTSTAAVQSSKTAIVELLEYPRVSSLGIVKMLRLKDNYLVEITVKGLQKLLTRMAENGLEVPEDVADFIRSACIKKTDGKYAVATNLKNPHRAELLRALGDDEDDGDDVQILGTRKVDGPKKQSKLDAWSKAGDSSDASVKPKPGLGRSAGAELNDFTPTLTKKSSTLDQFRARQAAASKPPRQLGSIRLLGMSEPRGPPPDAAKIKESRQREREATAKRNAEFIAKARALRGAKPTVPGEGSGLQGLDGVQGKDHAPQKSEMMVNTSSEDERDSDDDRAFLAQTKAGKNRVEDVSKRIIGLKQQQQVRGPVKKQKIQRSSKDMRARLIPSMVILHQTFLDWDIFHQGDDPPNGVKCSDVFKVYNDPVQFKSTFLPLLVYEAWTSFVMSKKESTAKAFGIKVQTRMSVDKFIEVTTTTAKAEMKDSWLGEGDIVLLSVSAQPLEDKHEPHCLARVSRNSFKGGNLETSYRITGSANSLLSLLVKGAELYAVKITNMTTIEREYAALESLQYYDLAPEILEAKPSPILKYSEERIKKYMGNYHLNAGQAKAVISAQENDGFTLVQGPPGTGKTKTIIAMVGALMTGTFQAKTGTAIRKPVGANGSNRDQGTQKKLLICAPSNAAVDELVLRLKGGVKSLTGGHHTIEVLRLGRSDAINSAVRDVTLDELVKARVEGDKAKNNGPTDRQKMHEEAGQIKQEITELRPLLEAARVADNRTETNELQRKFDNLKRRQMQIGQKIDADKDSGNTMARENEIRKRQIQQEILDSAQVLCSTLSGAGHEMLKNLNVEFETVIIDEAAQCVELSALIPLKYGCTKCILVGDPKQLPPTVLSRSAAKFGYSQSLFVRMQQNCPDDVHLLDRQYRMHPEISQFPSQEFYDGRLVDGDDMAKLRQKEWHQTGLLSPYRFFDVRGSQQKGQNGQSLVNHEEVRVAMQLYERFRIDNPKVEVQGMFGIITPYKAQLFQLRDKFCQRYGEAILDEIEFNTTDAFQGRECEIIIFSCVRASETGGIGFMTDIRRMNVGLTRAKSSLWVLGDSKALVQGEYWNKLIENAKARDRYTAGNVMAQLQRPGARVPASMYSNSTAARTPAIMPPQLPKPEPELVETVDMDMPDAPPLRPSSSHRKKSTQLPQTYTVIERQLPPAEKFSNLPIGYAGLNERGEPISGPITAERPVIHSGAAQKRSRDSSSDGGGGLPNKRAAKPLLPGRPAPTKPRTVHPPSSSPTINPGSGPSAPPNAPKGPANFRPPNPNPNLPPKKKPSVDPFIKRKPNKPR